MSDWPQEKPPERKRPEMTDAQREDVLLQLEHMRDRPRFRPRFQDVVPEPPPYPADDEGLTSPTFDNADDFITWLNYPAVPPPEVWEFYREHGRWPEPGEA